jgi:sacsin
MELDKSALDCRELPDMNNATYRCNVEITTENSDPTSQSWRVLHKSYPDSAATTSLSKQLGYDVGKKLQKHKLVPDIAIAMPIVPLTSSTAHFGRLYTFLPLPLSTGFPCHIHGLFALTKDRQHLRNGEEKGIVEGSDDRSVFVTTNNILSHGLSSVLVEWNRLLFNTFIPSTWAALLPILLNTDGFTNIFDAWPPPQPPVRGSDMYWNDLPCKVLSAIATDNLSIWPVLTSSDLGQTSPIFSELSSRHFQH